MAEPLIQGGRGERVKRRERPPTWVADASFTPDSLSLSSSLSLSLSLTLSPSLSPYTSLARSLSAGLLGSPPYLPSSRVLGMGLPPSKIPTSVSQSLPIGLAVDRWQREVTGQQTSHKHRKDTNIPEIA